MRLQDLGQLCPSTPTILHMIIVSNLSSNPPHTSPSRSQRHNNLLNILMTTFGINLKFPTHHMRTSPIVNSGKVHSISICLSYDRLTPSYRAFLATDPNIMIHNPLNKPIWSKLAPCHEWWIEGIWWEYICTLVTLPPGNRSIGAKWYYKVKYNSDENLVTKGNKKAWTIMGSAE